jgi:hypothetical protein
VSADGDLPPEAAELLRMLCMSTLSRARLLNNLPVPASALCASAMSCKLLDTWHYGCIQVIAQARNQLVAPSDLWKSAQVRTQPDSSAAC